MSGLVDRTGIRYGRLVAIKRAPNKGNRAAWLCQCDCGNQVIIVGNSLHAGLTKSCGCLHRERAARLNASHGMTGTPEHLTWKGMRQRCNNPNCQAYPIYGGRGISIDPRWDDFATFYTDMGPRTGPQYTIERIDNDGPYSPENCKWATRIEQANNTRRNRFLTLNGRTMTISQWAREIDMNQGTLFSRVTESEWPVKKALTTPVE